MESFCNITSEASGARPPRQPVPEPSAIPPVPTDLPAAFHTLPPALRFFLLNPSVPNAGATSQKEQNGRVGERRAAVWIPTAEPSACPFPPASHFPPTPFASLGARVGFPGRFQPCTGTVMSWAEMEMDEGGWE